MDKELVKKFPVLKFFKYKHLPESLQAISEPFAAVAETAAVALKDTPHPQELVKGLNKLLEAKDAIVRAALPAEV